MRHALLSLSLLIALAGTACADPCEALLPAKENDFSGEVTYIVDGDGFCVGHDRGGIEVRLADFDACELNEPGGEAARENLRKIVFGKLVECVAGRRSWGHVVAQCTVEGHDVGDVLRRAGTCEGGN
jgi:endonuclease YncB( thermonuclease family)